MNTEHKREYNRNYMRMRRSVDPEFGHAWLVKNREKMREYRHRYRTLHPERYRASKRRSKGARDSTGELKHGACEICARICNLHFDHDHANGEFRGWLCGLCNRGLGEFRDNVALLRKAIDYLERPLAHTVADYAERLIEQRVSA